MPEPFFMVALNGLFFLGITIFILRALLAKHFHGSNLVHPLPINAIDTDPLIAVYA